MSLRRFSTQTLVASVLLLAGCRDREVVSYRAPRDSAPPPVERPKMAMAGAAQGQLPDGHPPIGGANTGAPGAMPGADAMAAAGLPAGSVSQTNALTWTAPTQWQARAPGSIRKGSYTIAGEGGATADLSITAFPGDTGGLHANVNRWRGQIGLAPVDNAEVEKSVEHLDANGLHMDVVELAGTGNPPMRLLGAIVPHQGETWFFKLTGPDALVASQREAFRTFLTTVKAR